MIVEGVEIEFVEEEVVFKCRNCNYEWKFKEVKDKFDERIKEDIYFILEVVYVFFVCLKCGSYDFEVVKGRGVYVVGIKIEKEGGL